MKRPRGEQQRDTMFDGTIVVVATVFGQRCCLVAAGKQPEPAYRSNITATTDTSRKEKSGVYPPAEPGFPRRKSDENRRDTIRSGSPPAGLSLSPAAMAWATLVYSFQSPPGMIDCAMDTYDNTAYAVFEIWDHTRVVSTHPTPCVSGRGDRVSERIR